MKFSFAYSILFRVSATSFLLPFLVSPDATYLYHFSHNPLIIFFHKSQNLTLQITTLPKTIHNLSKSEIKPLIVKSQHFPDRLYQLGRYSSSGCVTELPIILIERLRASGVPIRSYHLFTRRVIHGETLLRS